MKIKNSEFFIDDTISIKFDKGKHDLDYVRKEIKKGILQITMDEE